MLGLECIEPSCRKVIYSSTDNNGVCRLIGPEAKAIGDDDGHLRPGSEIVQVSLP